MSADGLAEGGLKRWWPILDWLPRYESSWLRADIVAGVTAWALVVPQSIAYAEIARLPPQAGLAAAAAGLFGYALLGTSKQLLVSPTSSTAAVSASLVAAIAAGEAARYGSLSAALAIVLGVVFAIAGLAKIGFVARFIPYGVRIGFMAGLGLTIIVGQLTKILGVPGTSGTFIEQVGQLAGELAQFNEATVVVGVIALAALLIARRISPALPMALIVVVGGIVAVAVFGLAARGVGVVGEVTGGLPLPAIPAVTTEELLVLVPGAIAIAMLASAESLTVAQQFADDHRYEIRPDQEFVASGGANLLAGLFQGFVVGGGSSQSAANDRAGARTALSSLVVAGLTVFTMVALLPLFRDLPQAVLGAIVVSATIGFVRIGELGRIRGLRRDSFAIALIALVGTLLLGILAGLLTAVILSLLSLLTRLARPSTNVLHPTPGGGWQVAPIEGIDDIPGLRVVRLEAPLLFLNAGLVRDQVRAASVGADPVRVMVVDLEATSDLDIESLEVLGRLAARMREDGTELWLANVHVGVREVLDRAGPEATQHLRVFRDLRDAVDAFREPAAGSDG